jgi:hypothetical protein
LRGIKKAKFQQLVAKKPIAKIIVDDSMSEDDDDKMDTDKQVSFSPEVQVRVYRESPIKGAPMKGLKIDGIKSRLGATSVDKSPVNKSLHSIKKTVVMKPRKGSLTLASPPSKMKSDNMAQPAQRVHSRLSVKHRVNNFKPNSAAMKQASVFNRLGRNSEI